MKLGTKTKLMVVRHNIFLVSSEIPAIHHVISYQHLLRAVSQRICMMDALKCATF
jgi:hypothetical protein